MVRKIFIYQIIIAFLFFFAPKTIASPIDEIIKANPSFAPAIISISVKDQNSGANIYQKNAKTLVHPASTLKIITSSAALNFLGSDYIFKTGFYRNGNSIYMKVGADPLFTYGDMQNLVSQLKAKNQEAIKNFVIDDTIIDSEPYGIGWQWDDNADIHFPQMSPYIINRNLFMVKANISRRNAIAVEYSKEYKEPIINRIKYGETNNITTTRNIFSPELPIIMTGTINENKIIYIPAKNPKQLYYKLLLFAFISNDIAINVNFKYEKLPRFSVQEALISHSIDEVINAINTNSDNLSAEILLKHAGAAKNDSTGTTKQGLEIVKNFYESNGVKTDNIILVDASGASMNDYVTADFMTDALCAIKKSQNFATIENSMTDPSKGTFKGRLPELNGKIKVKTGTLTNTSAVVGYIKTNSGKDLTFAIMLDNLPKNVNAKEFENKIIRAIAQL